MTDLDLIQRNQIAIMQALAFVCRMLPVNAGGGTWASSLDVCASDTQNHLGLNQPPLPSLTEAVRAMKNKPWPDDVAAACQKAGKEEEQ